MEKPDRRWKQDEQASVHRGRTALQEEAPAGEAGFGSSAPKGKKRRWSWWEKRRARAEQLRRAEEMQEQNAALQYTADGYLRRSPVQPIREEPQYRRRLILRAVLAVILLIVVIAVLNHVIHP